MGMGWTIELGYRSGYLIPANGITQRTTPDDEWAMLCDVIENVRSEPHILQDTVKLFASSKVYAVDMLQDCSYMFTDNDKSKYTLVRRDEDKVWNIYTSGGGLSRTIRESIAVAFCMRVMLECASVGLHVNIVTH